METTLPTEEWINQMWYSYTVEYYSAIERNKVLTHATIWMNPKNMLIQKATAKSQRAYILWSYLFIYDQIV